MMRISDDILFEVWWNFVVLDDENTAALSSEYEMPSKAIDPAPVESNSHSSEEAQIPQSNPQPVEQLNPTQSQLNGHENDTYEREIRVDISEVVSKNGQTVEEREEHIVWTERSPYEAIPPPPPTTVTARPPAPGRKKKHERGSAARNTISVDVGWLKRLVSSKSEEKTKAEAQDR